MGVLDALKALWVLGVCGGVFLWLPTRLFSGRANSPRAIWMAGNVARTVVGVSVLVFVLSSLQVFGAITVVLLFVCALVVSRFRNQSEVPGHLLASFQTAAINIMRHLESGTFGLLLLTWKRRFGATHRRWALRVNLWLKSVENKELLWTCFAVALGITIVLRSEHALREMRFDQPEQYSILLRARELLLNIHPTGRPFVFPAVVAVTSVLSGIDPMPVTRFLTPVFSVALVLAAGLLIRVCGRMDAGCVAAIYCLGAAALPPARGQPDIAISAKEKIESILTASPSSSQASPEFVLGLLFLLVALAILADWYRNSRDWDVLVDFACCLLLTGIASQLLLVILVMAGAALLLRPKVGVFAFVVLCYGIVGGATLLGRRITPPDGMVAILPVAAAIFVGGFLALIEQQLVARWGPKAESALLVLCLAVALLWLRPQRLFERDLEYENAARVTQEIAYRFPRQTWQVAAPVEQLAETLGLGGHEDLAEFVEKYRHQVASPAFRFADAPEDLFIYVEKKPFQIFTHEPETVSFSVLTDPTYRNYRSPGGRASLEAGALQLCENYRQNHSNVDVFFEDDALRIYHIHQQAASGTKSGD